jgi:hypothetical protein
MAVMMEFCCSVGNGVYSNDLWEYKFFVALEMAIHDVNNRNEFASAWDYFLMFIKQ